MNIDKYTAAITEAVIAAAELGDEQTRRTAAALATAIAAPARLAVLAALSDMANEITEELGDRTVSVRLDGTDAVVAVHEEATPPHEDPVPTFEEMTGDISRVTLRLVEQIKSKAEEAAAQSGLSLNSWVAQAVQGALREQMRYQRRADEWRRQSGWTKSTSPSPAESEAPGTGTTDTGSTGTPGPQDPTGPDDTTGHDDA
ncbi:toxin-antitoxin system HicB family antitoxin [Rhodococcus sp. Z13]|uniref:Toxin-antitoxin system HicB family antitoxin n=1 Tax=Rhodococcus sacchari TaxID=2962047 RepID=A0ACD4DKM1_9NOCA|nr:toxin-antitoxin system HicB family antitoxin [Rhodococcus sp. Z13]UYP20585.1 toxin-antitoxin system HicB family antitoxin [Rhodococcus sp. Z13]